MCTYCIPDCVPDVHMLDNAPPRDLGTLCTYCVPECVPNVYLLENARLLAIKKRIDVIPLLYILLRLGS